MQDRSMICVNPVASGFLISLMGYANSFCFMDQEEILSWISADAWKFLCHVASWSPFS